MMMRTCALAVMLALGACDLAMRPWTSEGRDVQAIRAAEAMLVAAIAARDEAAVLANYHDDAVIEYAPIDEAALTAIASYRRLFAGDASALQYSPTRIEASQNGDVAASYGECLITNASQANAEPVSRDATCVKLWRPDKDGRWRIAREIREESERAVSG